MTAAKQAIRERVWSQLEQAGVVERGVRGYIPAFEGAARAAERLAVLPVWQQTQILEVAPDRAQLPVRIWALQDGKLVATTVHELQVLDEDLPEQGHDFRVDLIVTPERIIWPGNPRRPARLDLDSLSPEQIAAIPVLAKRMPR